MKRNILYLLCCFFLVLCLVSCASSSQKENENAHSHEGHHHENESCHEHNKQEAFVVDGDSTAIVTEEAHTECSHDGHEHAH